MYPRFIEPRVREVLEDTPVVLVIGPRRSGKTTLVHGMATQGRRYLTLDDQTTLDAARADPVGFVRGLDMAVIDEVQRVPELLLALKKSVDDDYRPGRFLLTGSANVMTLSRVADSLAGRMESIRLLPLAQGEIRGTRPCFLEDLFQGHLQPPRSPLLGEDLMELVLAGGFPEALRRGSERRRQDWGRAYLESVLTRDLQDIAEIERLSELPRFVRVLAAHAAQLANYSRFGSGIGVSYKTAQRYVGLLEKLFLVSSLEPWYTNRLKRLVKSPKLHFLDSGLLSSIRQFTMDRARLHREEFGIALETFVHAELLKLVSGSGLRVTPFHFRDQRGNEVDVVLERADGAVIGVEVKASATVSPSDLSGLRKLAEAAGSRFVFGALLYDGEAPVPFGARLAAVPISCLWNGSAS